LIDISATGVVEQGRSRRLITCGPNCEKEQQLNTHCAFSIREGTATIAGC